MQVLQLWERVFQELPEWVPKLASLESGLHKLVLRVVRRRSDAIQAQAFRNAHNA